MNLALTSILIALTSCVAIKQPKFPTVDLCRITTSNNSMTCYQLSESDLHEKSVTSAVRDSFQMNFRGNIDMKQADNYVAVSWFDFLNLLNYLNQQHKDGVYE